jgi:hypothetical protein
MATGGVVGAISRVHVRPTLDESPASAHPGPGGAFVPVVFAGLVLAERLARPGYLRLSPAMSHLTVSPQARVMTVNFGCTGARGFGFAVAAFLSSVAAPSVVRAGQRKGPRGARWSAVSRFRHRLCGRFCRSLPPRPTVRLRSVPAGIPPSGPARAGITATKLFGLLGTPAGARRIPPAPGTRHA